DGLAVSSNSKYLVTGHSRNPVVIWDLGSGKKLRSVENAKPRSSSGLFFIPGTTLLAFVLAESDDKATKIAIADARSGYVKYFLEGHGKNVYSIDISSDGSRLVSADQDTILVWDLKGIK